MPKAATFVIAAILLLILVALFIPTEVTNGPPRWLKMSNVKQLATGDLLYASDYDGHLPLMQWRSALGPYTKSAKLFESRMGEYPFIFAHRATLIGANHVKIPQPEEKVLFLDVLEASDPYVAELPALAFREPGKQATVAFADGHGKILSPAGAAKVH